MKSVDVYSLLGITQKAKKLISGQNSVEHAINTSKVYLIIVAEDTAENTRKRMEKLSLRKNIPIFFWGQSDKIGKAIGKERRKVIGIIDKGIAKAIYKRLNYLMGVGDIGKITRI
ncbi:MAG: L7Ae/L30e/S12e/Gadd45 family ribosomal protein [Tepidanaerobacteraceae bacterium]|nr:50S ribosomal protein L7ae [Thermoanaerobacterales bacterium]